MKKFIDIEAERAVLGSCILSSEAAMLVFDALKSDDFGEPKHAIIFDAMRMQAQEGKKFDSVLAMGTLRAMGQLDAVGGLQVFVDLQRSVPTAGNAEHYAKRIVSMARLRRLTAAARKVIDEAESAGDIDAYVNNAIEDIYAAAAERKQKRVRWALELATDAYKRIEERKDNAIPVAIQCGMNGFDALNVLRRGALIIIAARPNIGKTPLALGILRGAAGNGFTAFLQSIEMSESEIMSRWIASRSSIEMSQIDQATFEDADWARLAMAFGDFSKLSIGMNDDSDIGIDDFRLLMRRVHATRKIDIIAVDYLQLMKTRDAESRTLEIGKVGRGLKLMAKELDAAVIAVSQLNRGIERRSDGDPMLSDLRDSGELEQHADAVCFLHRDESDKKQLSDEAIIMVKKNRHGKRGEFKMHFDGRFQRFED